jgi:outer membrane lipoprotein-sorting protein
MSSRLTSCTPFLLAFLVLTACRSASEGTKTGSPSSELIASSTPPFQTKEPARYRATRTITIVSSKGEKTTTSTLVAKDGDLRRIDSIGMVYLETPQGTFVLLPDGNAYADLAVETSTGSAQGGEPSEISPEGLLHSDANHITSYQTLGTEMIDGRNANKYRVVVNSSSGGSVSVSETLIWIDGDLNMPIKSETKSAEGAVVTMQLSDLSLEVDKAVFQIPESYEKVTFSELQKRMKKSE